MKLPIDLATPVPAPIKVRSAHVVSDRAQHTSAARHIVHLKPTIQNVPCRLNYPAALKMLHFQISLAHSWRQPKPAAAQRLQTIRSIQWRQVAPAQRTRSLLARRCLKICDDSWSFHPRGVPWQGLAAFHADATCTQGSGMTLWPAGQLPAQLPPRTICSSSSQRLHERQMMRMRARLSGCPVIPMHRLRLGQATCAAHSASVRGPAARNCAHTVLSACRWSYLTARTWTKHTHKHF